MYIDILKLKAYKLLQNSDADLSRLLFLKKPTCVYYIHFSDSRIRRHLYADITRYGKEPF